MNPSHELIGEKPYHSIGHIPGSRVGAGDHTISDQEARLYFERVPNRPPETIVVQEKVDGTCVSVICDEHRDTIPVIRAGHRCADSPREMHHRFHDWCLEHHVGLMSLLRRNERVVGEWVAQAHGIAYDNLPSLFFVFDIKSGGRWLSTLEVMTRCAKSGLKTVPLIYYGKAHPVLPDMLKKWTKRSELRTKGPAEGLVFRREYNGERIGIAKWVRHDHAPGIYLPGTDNAVTSEPVWLSERESVA